MPTGTMRRGLYAKGKMYSDAAKKGGTASPMLKRARTHAVGSDVQAVSGILNTGIAFGGYAFAGSQAAGGNVFGTAVGIGIGTHFIGNAGKNFKKAAKLSRRSNFMKSFDRFNKVRKRIKASKKSASAGAKKSSTGSNGSVKAHARRTKSGKTARVKQHQRKGR